MTAREFTDDQIVDGIVAAIADRRFDVVEGLVALLAVQNPTRAADVVAGVRAGVALRTMWKAAGGL
jgi:hypothetical protein